jgi:hypothetical protein
VGRGGAAPFRERHERASVLGGGVPPAAGVGAQDVVIARLLAGAVQLPVEQVDERVRPQHDRHDPLHQPHEVVTAEHVGVLVDEHVA